MAVALVVLVLVLAATGGSDAAWCVCRSDVSDSALQKTLDYACGAGADCAPIHQNGPCFQPNTVRAHCSYAANSFFQMKGQAAGTCDFAGTATVSASDPSIASCVYPSSASPTGITTIPTSTTPTSTTQNGLTPTNGGVLGIGPSGTGITTDGSVTDGGLLLRAGRGWLLAAAVLPALVLVRA